MADSWIGSLNVNDWVQSLLNKEVSQLTNSTKKQTTQLNEIETGLNAQLSTYGSIQEYLNSLHQDLIAVKNAFQVNNQISLADPSIANATVVDTIVPGIHSLTVTQLATASSIASSFSVADKNSAANVNESLSISLGDANSPTASFTVNIANTDSLRTIADNINTAAKTNNAAVVATVVATGDNKFQLILSSTQTGQANALHLQESIVPGQAGLGMTTTLTTAQNAKFSYDNLSFETATNNNSVQGLNFNLLKLGTTQISSTVSNQVQTVKNALTQLVNDHNTLDNFIERKQAENLPDSTLSIVLSSLQSAVKSSFSFENLSLDSLASIGITKNSNVSPVAITYTTGKAGTYYPTGQLQIDDEKLSDALINNFSGVAQLLNDKDHGLLTGIDNLLQSGTGNIWKTLNSSDNGAVYLVNKRIKTVDQQIDAANDNLAQATKNLVYKYGQLNLVLSNLQGQSQYVTQQINQWNNK